MSAQLGQVQTRDGVAKPIVMFSAAMRPFSVLVISNVRHLRRVKP